MDELRIAPSEASRAEALELAFGHLEPEIRRQQVQTMLDELPPGEGLFEARRGDRLVGALCCHVQPGGGALAWLPRLIPGEPPETAQRLLAALEGPLRRQGVAMVNMLMETVEPAEHALLTAAGYDRMAELLYLVSGEDAFPTDMPSGPLEFAVYSDTDHDRMAKLVEATYEDTLDCPGLNNSGRSIDDVLLGYRETGEYAPERWRIVRHGGGDVGCLMVSDHPAHASCELVYMGLTVPSRGHGWGKRIARFAQWLTARAGRPRLVVAVDAANRPAISAYSSVGFHQWDRRIAYVKLFGTDGS